LRYPPRPFQLKEWNIFKRGSSGQDVVIMIWQKDAAVEWLGLNALSGFAQKFYDGGRYTRGEW